MIQPLPWEDGHIQEKKEEIWLNPMTEALTPTEKSKKQRVNTSGVSIIADVAESIAETEPISINRIEIWDRLIGKKGKRTSLQRTNCYWHEYTSICRLEKDGGAQCVSQTTRMLILPFPGTKSKPEVWKYFGFYRKAASPVTT